MATKKPFKPLLVHYDKEGHQRAEDLAESKLKLLDEASVWIHNQLDLKEAKINLKRLHLNMVEYFKDVILNHFMEVNIMGLSATKLIEAKEIPVSELMEIQNKYESIDINSDITFPDNIPTIEIHRKDFEIWTRNDKQNKRVIFGNQLIKAVNDLNILGVKVYPSNICTGTSNFLVYNMQKNKYEINRQEIFS